MTNALPRWRLNVEMKTKRTLHSSRRLSFNELTNAKNLVLHSSHFAVSCCCCCCALGERSGGGIWKFRTSSFKCYIDHSHTMYSSGNIDVRNWVHLFESRCISHTPIYSIRLVESDHPSLSLVLISVNVTPVAESRSQTSSTVHEYRCQNVK